MAIALEKILPRPLSERDLRIQNILYFTAKMSGCFPCLFRKYRLVTKGSPRPSELLHRFISEEPISQRQQPALLAGHLSGNRLHQSRHSADVYAAAIRWRQADHCL